MVAATGTALMDLNGIGPSGAARLLVEVDDITRFPDRGHFASWTGTAPIDVSFERAGVRPGAEPATLAGHDDDAHSAIGFGPG